MEWLEQNLDAYRIIGEILNDLRSVIRDQLEVVHGKTWYKTGLPEGLLQSLIEIKEREKAIDWYESEYQQVMSYAVFPDLLSILEHNPQLFPHVMRLAPTTALLHARFLELEVMRSKLGRARPISDTELAFLGTFHLRFRKAIDEFRAAPPATTDQAPPPPTPVEPVQVESAVDAVPAPSPGRPDPEPQGSPHATAPLDGSDTDPNLWHDDIDTSLETVRRPPQRVAETTRPRANDQASPRVEGAAPSAAATTSQPADDGAKPPPVDEALEEGDDLSVLRALYREVTHIADGIWTKDVLPSTKVWDKVAQSSWYERNFSRLGLKPLSDYYEIISKVDKRMRAGESKPEIQEFLKGANFAKVLLALRDTFQRNQI